MGTSIPPPTTLPHIVLLLIATLSLWSFADYSNIDIHGLVGVANAEDTKNIPENDHMKEFRLRWAQSRRARVEAVNKPMHLVFQCEDESQKPLPGVNLYVIIRTVRVTDEAILQFPERLEVVVSDSNGKAVVSTDLAEKIFVRGADKDGYSPSFERLSWFDKSSSEPVKLKFIRTQAARP